MCCKTWMTIKSPRLSRAKRRYIWKLCHIKMIRLPYTIIWCRSSVPNFRECPTIRGIWPHSRCFHTSMVSITLVALRPSPMWKSVWSRRAYRIWCITRPFKYYRWWNTAIFTCVHEIYRILRIFRIYRRHVGKAASFVAEKYDQLSISTSILIVDLFMLLFRKFVAFELPPKAALPSLLKILQMYSSMTHGVTLKSLCVRISPRESNIDER